jgi:hypothetical protein
MRARLAMSAGIVTTKIKILAQELAAVPGALVIPLGDFVTEVLQELVFTGQTRERKVPVPIPASSRSQRP